MNTQLFATHFSGFSLEKRRIFQGGDTPKENFSLAEVHPGEKEILLGKTKQETVGKVNTLNAKITDQQILNAADKHAEMVGKPIDRAKLQKDLDSYSNLNAEDPNAFAIALKRAQVIAHLINGDYLEENTVQQSETVNPLGEKESFDNSEIINALVQEYKKNRETENFDEAKVRELLATSGGVQKAYLKIKSNYSGKKLEGKGGEEVLKNASKVAKEVMNLNENTNINQRVVDELMKQDASINREQMLDKIGTSSYRALKEKIMSQLNIVEDIKTSLVVNAAISPIEGTRTYSNQDLINALLDTFKQNKDGATKFVTGKEMQNPAYKKGVIDKLIAEGKLSASNISTDSQGEIPESENTFVKIHSTADDFAKSLENNISIDNIKSKINSNDLIDYAGLIEGFHRVNATIDGITRGFKLVQRDGKIHAEQDERDNLSKGNDENETASTLPSSAKITEALEGDNPLAVLAEFKEQLQDSKVQQTIIKGFADFPSNGLNIQNNGEKDVTFDADANTISVQIEDQGSVVIDISGDGKISFDGKEITNFGEDMDEVRVAIKEEAQQEETAPAKKAQQENSAVPVVAVATEGEVAEEKNITDAEANQQKALAI